MVNVRELLDGVNTIALVGASDKPTRDSYKVMRFLLDAGYQVFPINPRLTGKNILGCQVYGALADVPLAIDMVDVFRDAKFLYAVVKEAKQANISRVWAQIGVVDSKAKQFAAQNNIMMIMDRCPAIEIPKLG